MNAPTLFDAPAVRATDPSTSYAAAERSAPGNGDKIRAIRKYVRDHGPATAWEIAEAVDKMEPGRWDRGGIRSACNPKRSGLVEIPGGEKVDHAGRVRPVMLYALRLHYDRTEPVEVAGEVL